MFQQHACVSQGQICSNYFRCCHTETEVADQTFYLTQSQYADTTPTSPRADPITPGACRVATWMPFSKSLVRLDPEKSPRCKRESNLGSSAPKADAQVKNKQTNCFNITFGTQLNSDYTLWLPNPDGIGGQKKMLSRLTFFKVTF